MIIQTSIYTVLLILLLSVSDNNKTRKYYVPLKAACSASFLVIFLLNHAFCDGGDMLFIPLIACFIGDIFMGSYNVTKARKYLYYGMCAFILAHIGFLGYMMEMTSSTSIIVFIIPIIVVIIISFVIKFCHIHLGTVKIPALIYCLFVSAMTTKALCIGRTIGVAGLLFFISDFSIMFVYFFHFKNKWVKKIVRYINLVTYYLAILLFIYAT